MPPGGLLPGSVGGQSPAPTRAATGWTAEADDLLELLPVDAPSNNSTAVVELGGESFEHVLFVDNDQDQPRPAPTAAVHVQDQGNPRQPNILSRVASYLLPKENSSRGGTDAKLWSPRLERVTDQLRVSMDGPSSSGNLLKNMPRGPGTSKLRPMHSTGRSTEGGITGHLYAKSMGRSFSALRSWIPNREAQQLSRLNF